jgi:hypothetical protein
MAMYDVGFQEQREESKMEWVALLSSNVCWITKDPHGQSAVELVTIFVPKCDETCFRACRHVTRELERVAFCATDSAIRTEERRNYVNDFHCLC